MHVSRPAAAMNRNLIHALLAAACLAAGRPAGAAARVWVVDDGLRMDPRTGKAFEESEAYPEALKPGQDYWQPRERDSRSHDPGQWDEARRKLAGLLERK
jgi:hypothetical protein